MAPFNLSLPPRQTLHLNLLIRGYQLKERYNINLETLKLEMTSVQKTVKKPFLEPPPLRHFPVNPSHPGVLTRQHKYVYSININCYIYYDNNNINIGRYYISINNMSYFALTYSSDSFIINNKSVI